MDNFINIPDFLGLFLPYFIWLGFGIVVVYFFGGIFRSLYFKTLLFKLTYRELFLNPLVGLVASVTLFSLFCTIGKSINFLFLLLGLFLLIERNQTLLLEKDRMSIQQVLIFIPFLFIVYLFSFSLLYQAGESIPLGVAVKDDLFYALISHYIRETGIENTSHVASTLEMYNLDGVPKYYHYFELWITSLFSFLTGEKEYHSLYLFTSPVLLITLFFGVVYLFEDYWSKFTVWKRVVTFILFVSLTGFSFSFYENVLSGAFLVHSHSYLLGTIHGLGAKALIYPLFLIQPLISSRTGDYKLAGISVLALPVATIVSAPSVFLCLLLFIFIMLFKKRYYGDGMRLALYVTLFFGSLVAFYFLSGTFSINSPKVDVPFPLWKELYIRFRITVSMTLKPLVHYLPYLLLLLISKDVRNYLIRKRFEVFYFLILLLLISFSASFFYKKNNYLQIASLLHNGLLRLSMIFLVFKALSSSVSRGYLAVSLCLLIGFYANKDSISLIDRRYQLNKSYFQELDKLIREGDQPKAVYLASMTFPDAYGIASLVYVPFHEFTLLNSGLFPLSLNHATAENKLTDPIDSANFEVARFSDPFVQFVEQQKSKSQFESIEQSQYDFILYYKPDILGVTANAKVPSLIKPLIKDSIYDKQSGKRVYSLKKENF